MKKENDDKCLLSKIEEEMEQEPVFYPVYEEFVQTLVECNFGRMLTREEMDTLKESNKFSIYIDIAILDAVEKEIINKG